MILALTVTLAAIFWTAHPASQLRSLRSVVAHTDRAWTGLQSRTAALVLAANTPRAVMAWQRAVVGFQESVSRVLAIPFLPLIESTQDQFAINLSGLRREYAYLDYRLESVSHHLDQFYPDQTRLRIPEAADRTDFFPVPPPEKESEEVRNALRELVGGAGPFDFFLGRLLSEIDRYIGRQMRALNITTTFLLVLVAAAGFLFINDRLRSDTRERLYRATISSMREGVLIADRNNRIVYLNPAAARIIGRRRSAIIDRPIPEVFPVLTTATAGSAGESPSRAFHAYSANWNGIFLSITRSPVQTGQNRFAGTAYLMRDMVQWVRLQNEVNRNGKVESLATLAGGVAHDLNNILAGILGNLELLRISVENTPETETVIRMSKESVTRARDLSATLLTISGGGAHRKELVDLVTLIQESARRLPSDGWETDYELPERPTYVYAEPAQLRDAVYHILVNAAEAMRDGGTLHIRVGTVARGQGNRRFAAVEVSDTGSGISDESVHRVFDPFFTTKSHHKGLGLSLAYFVVRHHGGTLEIESTPARGTTVNMLLPTAEFLEERQGRASVVEEPPARILLVDADQSVRRVAERMLARLGHHCESVSTLSQAEALVGNHAVEIVILDTAVSEAEDMSAAVKRIRESAPHVRIVLSTGATDTHTAEWIQQLPQSAVLVKPYKLSDLQAALSAVFL